MLLEANNLGKKSVVLMPGTQAILETMGEQIKMARLRCKISADLVAGRAGISRATLWSVEKGSPSVSVGIYAAVLHALNGMEKDLLLCCKRRCTWQEAAGFGFVDKKVRSEKKTIFQ